MRDARTQGREVGRSRRDRDLAGRGARSVDPLVETFLRLAGAIVLDTLAFALWNVGSRTPLELLADARRAFTDARALFGSVVAIAIGFVFVAAATVLVVPALADPAHEFVPIEFLTLVVALALDYLVGNDLRALTTPRDA
jgi:hypothetical protein